MFIQGGWGGAKNFSILDNVHIRNEVTKPLSEYIIQFTYRMKLFALITLTGFTKGVFT